MPLYHHKMNHQSKFGEDWTSNNLDMTITGHVPANLPEIKKIPQQSCIYSFLNDRCKL